MRVPGRLWIPDYSDPIVGWRCWRFGAPRTMWVPDPGPFLQSLNSNDVWEPGQAVEASPGMMSGCMLTMCACVDFDGRKLERSPGLSCSCGIYAFKDYEAAHEVARREMRGTYFQTRDVIWGEVYLWGRIIEHSGGYRAQFAYPKSLMVPDSYWFTCSRERRVGLAEAVGFLGERFGIPVRRVPPFGRPSYVEAC